MKALTDTEVKAHDTDRESTLRRIANDIDDGRISVDEAVERMIYEMGRGGRTILLDETSFGLDSHLSSMNYTVESVPPGTPDEEIKKILRSRVLVTENGKDFAAEGDMVRFHYGVIWLISRGDEASRAKRVKDAMMAANFSANLHQCMRV